MDQTMSAVETAGLTQGPLEVVTLRGSVDLAVIVSAPLSAWRSHPDVTLIEVHEAYTSSRGNQLTLELLSGPGMPR